MKKIFITSIITALAFASCSKEKTDPVSRTQLLTASPWYYVRSTLQVNGVTTESPYNTEPICWKDDLFYFKSDGNLIITQGATKCYPGAPDYSLNYYWELKDNETTLSQKRTNNWQDWQIVKLTGDSLVIKLADGSYGNKRIYTDYYAHSF